MKVKEVDVRVEMWIDWAHLKYEMEIRGENQMNPGKTKMGHLYQQAVFYFESWLDYLWSSHV